MECTPALLALACEVALRLEGSLPAGSGAGLHLNAVLY